MNEAELLSLSEEESYGALKPAGKSVSFEAGPKKVVTVRAVLA